MSNCLSDSSDFFYEKKICEKVLIFAKYFRKFETSSETSLIHRLKPTPMKKTMLFIALCIATATLTGQVYQITFTGSGQSTSVASVKVWNLTRDTMITMNGSDTLRLVNPSGTPEMERDYLPMAVYPNPSPGNGSVEFNTPQQEDATIRVYDLSGKCVLHYSANLPGGTHRLAMGGLNSGIYYVQLQAGLQKQTRKWVSVGNPSGTPFLTPEILGAGSLPNGRLSGTKSMRQLPYVQGEILMFRATSGNYSRIVTLVPTQSQAVDFEFIACTDGSNKHYPVVTIGTQTWMAENLKTTKYKTGIPIPLVTDPTTWTNVTTPAMCWYDNDSASHAATYGALYKWYTVETGNLCPNGWHIPTVAEWTTLANYLGGDTLAGGKMKETGTIHWDTMHPGTTNASGFTALPGGLRAVTGGTFSNFGLHAYFWSASFYSASFANSYSLSYNLNKLNGGGNNKANGFSVRCVKD
jgi:uncharacterized protein (TIGR02145 family)